MSLLQSVLVYYWVSHSTVRRDSLLECRYWMCIYE